jgi:hypothetical protein
MNIAHIPPPPAAQHQTMYAVTLHQPWAWAILNLGKNLENRSWAPSHARMSNQPLIIHAGQAYDDSAEAWMRRRGLLQANQILPAAARIKGSLIGSVIYRASLSEAELAELKTEEGDRARSWWTGPLGWLLAAPQTFPAPVPCPGAQRLWRVPPAQRDKIHFLVSTQHRQWLNDRARALANL